MRRPCFPGLFQGLGQGQGGCGIVGPVQQDPGVLGDPFQAARPARLGQTLPDGGLGHRETVLVQQFHHRQGHRGIAMTGAGREAEAQTGDMVLIQAEIIEATPGISPWF